MTPVLYVGNRNYSSWSLRGWLAMAWSGLDFTTRDVELDADGYGEARIAAVAAVSPSGRVPALELDGVTLWDSLAIAEWAAERAPQAALWPDDAMERALARSLTCEMHAGFAAIRTEAPCNIRRRVGAVALSDAAQREVARIDAIFASQAERAKGRGPYLFGRRGVVDAFYLPIATRLRTYSVALSPAAGRYRDTLLGDDAFLSWEREAQAQWRGPMRHGDADTRHG